MTDSPKILVFGRTGQLATELQRRADVTALGRDLADLTRPELCRRVVLDRAPSVVINAAAYTAVDAAEGDEQTAHLVNCDAPAAMAQACAEIGAVFVHISTDYVFDGSGEAPHRTGDPCAPLGVYGRTKRSGEEAVMATGANAAIIRTSWVFSAHGKNFVKTMLRLGAERAKLTIVGDQIGGPTEAGDLAEAALAVAAMLRRDPSQAGIYHFAGQPYVSWADFAREIFNQAGLSAEVADIESKDFPTPALRPYNSRLDCSDLAARGIAAPDWRLSLKAVIAQLTS